MMKELFRYIKEIAERPSIHPNEGPVREYIIGQLKKMKKKFRVDEVGNVHILTRSMPQFLLSAHMDKQAEPFFEEKEDKIIGKLDDAVGCGIILALSRDHDIHAILTVGEEGPSLGAYFAVEDGSIPDVEGIIVIDTSPRGNMGKGPAFYINFDGVNPDDSFIALIKDRAKLIGVPLQPMPGAINDGCVFIHYNKNTVALEPHIDNYHTSEEISSKDDILNTYKLLESILKEK